MNLPVVGKQPQKARFLREIAQAMEFLALFYSLSEADQEKIIATINKMTANET